MKATLFLILFSIMLVCCSDTKDIEVNNPAFGVRSANFLEIEKVVLKKDATIVYMVGIIGGWIRVQKDLYLLADGKEYPVQDAMNLAFGQQTYGDEEGKWNFALIFPPLPPQTERFDLCNNARTVITWDVELKKPKKVPALPEEFVKASLISDDSQHLEAPQWKDAKATLKGFIAGYKPELKFNITVYVDNIIVGEQEEYDGTVNDDGTFEMTIPMLVTSQVFLRISIINSAIEEDNKPVNDYILLSPDKETHLYVDLPAYFRKIAKYRHDKNPDAKLLYFAGANAELNNLYFHTGFNSMIKKSLLQNNDISNISATEYKALILKNKEQYIAEIERYPSVTLKAKEFFRMILDYQAAYELNPIATNMVNAYRRLHNLSHMEIPKGFKPPVLNKAYYDYLKDLPLNDYISLYCNKYYNAVYECKYIDFMEEDTDMTVSDVLGTSEGLLFDIIQCQRISFPFLNMTPLTEESEEKLKHVKDPLCAQQVRIMNQRLIDRIEANKLSTTYRVHDVKGKEGDDLYQAIIGKEKGKVVLIDFWATWCGPCKLANKIFKSAKNKLDTEKVTFIYLTDETSPLATWNNMISELSGDHYRLTASQNKYIQKRLGEKITGVPSYLILDKTGEKVYFQVGFPGPEALVDKINEELTK